MGDSSESEEQLNQSVTGRSSIQAEAKLTLSVAMHMRTYLSPYHILTAAFFTRQSAAMERQHLGTLWSEEFQAGPFAEHRAYVVGAVFAAVAFLEATINELFNDALEKHQAAPPVEKHTQDPISWLAEPVRNSLGKRWQGWRAGTDRVDALSKFQLALSLAGKKPLPKGEQPYQNVSLLNSLRVRLIHFEPEWTLLGEQPQQANLHPIEQALRGKFALNPLMPENTSNPFFPDKVLSHGCAKWAVQSSLEFNDTFCIRLGIPTRYEQYRPFGLD